MRRVLIVFCCLGLASIAYAGRGDIYSAKAIKALEALINSTGAISLTTDSSGNLSVTTSKNVIVPGGLIQICDTSSANCVNITREAAATLQLGSDVNGAPVNQTLKSHDGITGTDVKGASLILESGLGTGSAVSNPPTINRVVTKATGTTAQTYAPAVIICPTKALSTTTGTAQTIATITTTSLTSGGFSVVYATSACSGSTCNADTGQINVAYNNPSGTVAATAGAVLGRASSNGSGTLDTAPTVTVGTNIISFKFTPAWATIVPTSVTGFAIFTVSNLSGDTVACQ